MQRNGGEVVTRIIEAHEFMTTTEVHRYLRIGRSTLAGWAKSDAAPIRAYVKRFPSGKRHYLWRRSDVDAYLVLSSAASLPKQTEADSYE